MVTGIGGYSSGYPMTQNQVVHRMLDDVYSDDTVAYIPKSSNVQSSNNSTDASHGSGEAKKESGFFGKLFRGIGSFFKGAVKAVGNMIKSAFTLKGILTIAAFVALSFTPLGPAALIAGAIYGLATGGKDFVTGTINGIQAYASGNDEAGDKYLEQAGGGALVAGLSLAGARGALKSSNVTWQLKNTSYGSTAAEAAGSVRGTASALKQIVTGEAKTMIGGKPVNFYQYSMQAGKETAGQLRQLAIENTSATSTVGKLARKGAAPQNAAEAQTALNKAKAAEMQAKAQINNKRLKPETRTKWEAKHAEAKAQVESAEAAQVALNKPTIIKEIAGGNPRFNYNNNTSITSTFQSKYNPFSASSAFDPTGTYRIAGATIMGQNQQELPDYEEVEKASAAGGNGHIDPDLWARSEAFLKNADAGKYNYYGQVAHG